MTVISTFIDPAGSFQSKRYMRFASMISMVEIAKFIPGHILHPLPNDKKANQVGRGCLRRSPPGKTWKLFVNNFLYLRLGVKSVLKRRGVLAAQVIRRCRRLAQE